MRLHQVQFTGAIFERGFWLYAWRVQCGARACFYVGRTGDSSSQYAASPFSRLNQHLDLRPKAAANMLLRHVRTLKLDPLACSYELLALGPVFPEQSTLELHRKFRDRIAPLETALADFIRSRGHEVVGKHGPKGKPDPKLVAELQREFDAALVK
jgi:hypothetical protein